MGGIRSKFFNQFVGWRAEDLVDFMNLVKLVFTVEQGIS